MWARNFFCCALMGKRFQGVKDYPWGARKMHNEVRPSANPWRISSRLLTDCMLTFAFEPKRVSFVCVTKKHTFPRASSRWRNSQPPNSSRNFGCGAFWRRRHFEVFCTKWLANHSKRFLRRHLLKSNADQKWARNFASGGEVHANVIACALRPTNGM